MFTSGEIVSTYDVLRRKLYHVNYEYRTLSKLSSMICVCLGYYCFFTFPSFALGPERKSTNIPYKTIQNKSKDPFKNQLPSVSCQSIRNLRI